jgi:hypothetical protein
MEQVCGGRKQHTQWDGVVRTEKALTSLTTYLAPNTSPTTRNATNSTSWGRSSFAVKESFLIQRCKSGLDASLFSVYFAQKKSNGTQTVRYYIMTHQYWPTADNLKSIRPLDTKEPFRKQQISLFWIDGNRTKESKCSQDGYYEEVASWVGVVGDHWTSRQQLQFLLNPESSHKMVIVYINCTQFPHWFFHVLLCFAIFHFTLVILHNHNSLDSTIVCSIGIQNKPE